MKTTAGKIIIAAFAIVAIGIGGYFFFVSNNEKAKPVRKKLATTTTTAHAKKMTIYRSPNCNCCLGYADEMKRQGFNVEVVALTDMNAIKEKYKIPLNRQSCHTTIIDNYFIEGHVPIEAVRKLLKERPEIDGIGLPEMPTGTPGMPGAKLAPYKIYQSVDGKFSEYITL